MDFSAEIRGLEDLIMRVEDVHHTMGQIAQQGALQAAQFALEYAKGEILSGHLSMPGGPPKSVTGELVSSMVARAISGGAEFRINSDHAKHVEYGMRKMAAHPFAGPAVARAKQDFLNTLRAMVMVSVRFNVVG